jgi:hypothetical protein
MRIPLSLEVSHDGAPSPGDDEKNNGTLKDGQAMPAHYTSHAPERNCMELASPVPQFGYFFFS